MADNGVPTSAEFLDHDTRHESGGADELDVTGLPGAGSPPTAYAAGSFTIATGNFRIHAKTLILTGVERATIEGTGRLVIL